MTASFSGSSMTCPEGNTKAVHLQRQAGDQIPAEESRRAGGASRDRTGRLRTHLRRAMQSPSPCSHQTVVAAVCRQGGCKSGTSRYLATDLGVFS